MDVSIVIVSFNTRDLLLDCLDAVETCTTGLVVQTIVVDNHSEDDSVAAVRERFPRVEVIANSDNRMFARASNQGIAVSRGRFVLLLNSDAFLAPGALQALVRFMDAHPRAAAAGPRVLNMDGTLQSKGFVVPRIGLGLLRVSGLQRLLPESIRQRLFPRYYWSEDTAVMPDVLSGCCVLLRTQCLREIGALDETFYHGGEDGEWCLRAVRAGYEIWYRPESTVRHVGGASRACVAHEVLLADTVHAWRTGFGIGYGAIAECLSLVHHTQRWLLRTLAGGDRAAAAADMALAMAKVRALLAACARCGHGQTGESA